MLNQGNLTTKKTYFEVEAIIDHKVKPNGGIEYLLKWKDFGEEENSWINEEDTKAPSLIRHYWSNKYKNNDVVKRKRGRPKRGVNRANRANRGRKSSRNVDNRQDITTTIQSNGLNNGSNGLNDEKNTADVYMIDTDERNANRQEPDSDITNEDVHMIDNEINEYNIEIPQWLQGVYEENERTKCYFTPYDYSTWENCATILNVVRETNNDVSEIFIHIKWPDGTDSYHLSKEVYQKCPLKMIQYYEQHLIFKD